mmetsp:Transcript_9347/g.8249  ORF Transcript_9347/g.8249 Transcript_9347/m.8249 type:complete len:144 (+) Transcript_9347:324-755(+)
MGINNVTYDQKVKEALDINLLNICEKKEVAEQKVYELSKTLDKKIEKIKELEYETYLLKKKNKEMNSSYVKMEKDLKAKTEDVERLLDILYGTDKAKEYAKLDAQSWKDKQVRGYHVGPPVHVSRGMYDVKNKRVLKQTEPNY